MDIIIDYGIKDLPLKANGYFNAIGYGSCGTTYRISENVAAKVFYSRRCAYQDVRIGRLVDSIGIPVPRLLGLGEVEERIIAFREFIDAVPSSQILNRQLARQVEEIAADMLDFCEENGFTTGDEYPKNVLFRPSTGKVYLIDFCHWKQRRRRINARYEGPFGVSD